MASSKKKHKIDVLLIIAILLFVAGVILLLIDPIKNWQRKKKVEEVIQVVESQIMLEDTEITFVVNTNDYVVNGEDIDVYVEDGFEEDFEAEASIRESMMQDEVDSLPEYVTLTCIGLLDIESIELHYPIWDESSVVALRYGLGLFEDSVLPGQPGNCAILGHHMRARGSMFNRLDEVQLGDTVKVTVPGGHEYIYIVDEIIVVEARDLLDYINGDITTTEQITLVTCTYTSTGKKRLLVIGHCLDD